MKDNIMALGRRFFMNYDFKEKLSTMSLEKVIVAFYAFVQKGIISTIGFIKFLVGISILSIFIMGAGVATVTVYREITEAAHRMSANSGEVITIDSVREEMDSIINNYEMDLTSERAYSSELKEANEDLAKHSFELSSELAMYKTYGYAMSNRRHNLPLEVIEEIDSLSKQYKIPAHVIIALMYVESKFDPVAQSGKSSATGYGQVLKGTGKWLWEDIMKEDTPYNHSMALDPIINTRMTVAFLDYLLKRRNGNFMRALIDYNGNSIGKRYYNRIHEFLLANVDTPIGAFEREYRKLNNL